MVEPFAPTIDPSSAAGNDGPKAEWLFGCVPVGGLMDFDCHSEFAKFVAIGSAFCAQALHQSIC